MKIELTNAINTVVNFTNLHRIEAVFQINTKKDLLNGGKSQDERWSKFEKKAGVYLFIPENDEGIQYIGMSEKDVGSRVHQWLIKDNKVSRVTEPNDIILTISLDKQPYMSPALESYLISHLDTKLNIMKNT